MHINDMLLLLRDYVDEPSADAADWSDEELLRYMNREHSKLFSCIRGMKEDFFGREHVFLTTASVYKYPLPTNFITLRRIELISGGVTGTAPFFSVNEDTASKYEVLEVKLNNKDATIFTNVTGKSYAEEGFYLYGDNVCFAEGTRVGSLYCRLFFMPEAPTLHRATAQAGGLNTITLGVAGAAQTLGTIRTIHKYYDGMLIEIMSGTGAGQINRVLSYNGSTKVATMVENWTTTPDATSVYSIVSPIVEDYHELIPLGGAIRAKGIKTEDDTSDIGAVYSTLLDEMKTSLESRIEISSRRVVNSRGLWS